MNTMKQRFTQVTLKPNGFNYFDTSRNCSVSCLFDTFLIREARDKGCNFEDLADGFGSGMGTMGGDWSGIRDSSVTAIEKMFERALNFLFKN